MTIEMHDLRETSEFLNILLDNINASVLIMDEDFRLQHVNDHIFSQFGISPEDLGTRCGNALGCSFAVLEGRECGETSHCGDCELRRSATHSLRSAERVDKLPMVREFRIKGEMHTLHFQVSTRPISFRGQKMTLAMLYDVTDLENQRRDLLEQRERIRQDLHSAAEIQRSLLPSSSPFCSSFRYAWRFLPCETVGGDLFSILPLDETRQGISMLDVCGHGVKAALQAMSVSQAILSMLTAGRREDTGLHVREPHQIMQALERQFPFDRYNSYFTAQYLLLDTATGGLRHCSAGHMPPMLLPARGAPRRLEAGGPAIGVGSPLPFTTHETTLAPGDKILLYTDGAVEARSRAGDMYGEDRFEEQLRRHAELPVEELVEALHKDLLNFAGGAPFPDDISILGIEYRP